VWRAITEPEELAHWFPAAVELDLRERGSMTFRFPDESQPPSRGQVTELDPPHRFAFDWAGQRLRFQLDPEGDAAACLLRFTVLLSAEDTAARDAAGWHVCLGLLEERLGGGEAQGPSSAPTGEWRALYDDYRERGVPAGAPVPGDS
jgi:uncharacterized protein YndB with AHSA1/START domain